MGWDPTGPLKGKTLKSREAERLVDNSLGKGLEYIDLGLGWQCRHIVTGSLHRLAKIGLRNDVIPGKDRRGAMA